MTEGDTNAGGLTSGSNPDVRNLSMLVGEWALEITGSDLPQEVRGWATFEWLVEGSFLIS